MHDLLKLTRDDPGSPLVGRDRAQSSRSQWAAGNRHGTALEQAKLNGFFLGQGSTVKVVSWWVHSDFEFEKHIQHHTTKIAPLVAQTTLPVPSVTSFRRLWGSQTSLPVALHAAPAKIKHGNLRNHEKKPQLLTVGFFSDFNPDVSEHVLQAKWMSKSAKFIHFPAVGMLVTKARHQGASAYPGKSILTWRAQRLVVESPIPTTILLYIIHIYIYIFIYIYIYILNLHEGEHQKALSRPRFFARRREPKSTIFCTKESTQNKACLK